MRRKKLQLVLGGIVIFGGIGGLIVYSFNQNLVYDHSVAEYLADPALQRTTCRVYGKVKPNSVVRAPGGIGVQFAVTDGEREVAVLFEKEVPDTFKENGDVVVEGRRDAGGLFQARMLLAKCPSKYEKEGMEDQQRPGEERPYSGSGS